MEGSRCMFLASSFASVRRGHAVKLYTAVSGVDLHKLDYALRCGGHSMFYFVFYRSFSIMYVYIARFCQVLVEAAESTLAEQTIVGVMPVLVLDCTLALPSTHSRLIPTPQASLVAGNGGL